MSQCQINHSYQDVINKLESQKEFIPGSLFERTESYLNKDISQENLNELFHLLKKYDLASQVEKEERNDKIDRLVG